jgi:hypothetical protein
MNAKHLSLEEKYEEIMRLYDLADELLTTVESRFVENQDQQLKLVEPLVEDIGSAADELTEEFINIAEGKIKRSTRSRIETALRKVYMSLDEYARKLHGGVYRVSGKAGNIADAVIAKIKEEMDRIIIIFLDFIQISLDRVMHRNEIEELKRRHTDIAFQLHNMSQQY